MLARRPCIGLRGWASRPERLRMAFGAPMANETLLASPRVQPERLDEAGFRFEDEELGAALRALPG